MLATAASDPLPASALGAIAVANFSAAPVVLFEAGPDMTGTKPLSGSVSWRSETIVSPLWLGPERAVRAEIDIPGKGTVTVLVRRNFDQGFLASHAIVIVPSFGSEGVGINEIPGVLMKRSGEPRGSPLRGVPMTAEGGQFQILLSAAAADIESNERMLRERPVLGIPIIYNDGRRSLLTIEKGEQGDRAFEEAFAQWGSATPIEPPDLLRLAPWNFPTGNPPATTERLRDPSGTKKGDGNRRNPCGPNAGPCGVHPPAPTKLMTQIGAAAPTIRGAHLSPAVKAEAGANANNDGRKCLTAHCGRAATWLGRGWRTAVRAAHAAGMPGNWLDARGENSSSHCRAWLASAIASIGVGPGSTRASCASRILIIALACAPASMAPPA